MAEDYEVEEFVEEEVPAERETVKNLETVEAKSEEVVEVAEVVEEVKPAPTPVSVSPKRKPSKSSAVESKIGEVEVVLSALTYQASSRNSASVRVLQDRLAELGHGSVRRDRQGWLSDGTVEALREFQGASGLDATGEADRDTVEAVMKGTKATVV